ncbi:hypothetical protein ABT330_31555 [Streptomyces sp. NPDC000658]|uniref:hypothetical protein n=1 Tax=Streptomyces sp. NPDC000658 TaxID=3154266 RepID=UPI003323A1EE
MFDHPRGWVLAVIALMASTYTRLFRRIEDARTPVAIWDDPRLTAQPPVADRAAHWQTAPRRA